MVPVNANFKNCVKWFLKVDNAPMYAIGFSDSEYVHKTAKRPTASRVNQEYYNHSVKPVLRHHALPLRGDRRLYACRFRIGFFRARLIDKCSHGASRRFLSGKNRQSEKLSAGAG